MNIDELLDLSSAFRNYWIDDDHLVASQPAEKDARNVAYLGDSWTLDDAVFAALADNGTPCNCESCQP